MLTLRKANPDDQDQLAELGLYAWTTSIGKLVRDEICLAMSLQNPFTPFIQSMGPRILVAEVNGEIAGFAGREHDDQMITDLWVYPDFEGRGVGRRLIQQMEQDICASGHQIAEIHVAALNRRALSLYLHLGYQTTWHGLEHDKILGVELEKCHLEKTLISGP